jgi:hypothetical protein
MHCQLPLNSYGRRQEIPTHVSHDQGRRPSWLVGSSVQHCLEAQARMDSKEQTNRQALITGCDRRLWFTAKPDGVSRHARHQCRMRRRNVYGMLRAQHPLDSCPSPCAPTCMHTQPPAVPTAHVLSCHTHSSCHSSRKLPEHNLEPPQHHMRCCMLLTLQPQQTLLEEGFPLLEPPYTPR